VRQAQVETGQCQTGEDRGDRRSGVIAQGGAAEHGRHQRE
jgi:hypothetical protein